MQTRHDDEISELEALVQRLDALTLRVDSIYAILHKFEGMSILVKIVFFAILPIIAMGAWIKDHIK